MPSEGFTEVMVGITGELDFEDLTRIFQAGRREKDSRWKVYGHECIEV